ncbi:MAG: DUF91 domain-containing protein, partial [Anaerolineae bacterium]|nr:DUF91 domain-containing protein [Anaerolineae bacterium]
MSRASDRDASGSGTLNRVDLFRTVNGKVQWCEDEPLHRGYIDTLGLDEYGSPVVIEYKRRRDENVINQGLVYLHWLEGEEARARVRGLAREKLDVQDVDFDGAWLLCVAWQFPRRDVVAAHYSQKFVMLMKYGHFGDGVLALVMIFTDRVEDVLDAGSSDSRGA